MIQQLESRRLLAVSAIFPGAGGALTITGTDQSDRIEVILERVVAGEKRAGGDRLEVYSDGELILNQELSEGEISRIELYGGGGMDGLFVTNAGTATEVLIFGEGDNDTMAATSTQGAPGAVLDGGRGDDILTAFADGSTATAHALFGGQGADIIVGSSAGDMIQGDYPDMLNFVGESTNDLILGGGGDDRISGGLGDDVLLGQDGDDWLDGGEGSDFMDGGPGVDTAIADWLDTVQNVEHVFLPLEPRPDRLIDLIQGDAQSDRRAEPDGLIESTQAE